MRKHWKQFTALFLALAMVLVSGIIVTNRDGFKAGSHTHTDECYGAAQGDQLICEKEVHLHTDDCFEWDTIIESVQAVDEDGNLVFDEDGYPVYSGTKETPIKGDMICGKEEHEHDMSCYSQIVALTCEFADVAEEESGWFNLTIEYQFADWDNQKYVSMPQFTTQDKISADGQIKGGAITTPVIEDADYYYVVDDMAKDSRGGWNGTMEVTYQNFPEKDYTGYFPQQAIIKEYNTSVEANGTDATITGDIVTEIWYLRYPKEVLDDMLDDGEEEEESGEKVYNFEVAYMVIDPETGVETPFEGGAHDFTKKIKEDGTFVDGPFTTDYFEGYADLMQHLYKWDETVEKCWGPMKEGGNLSATGNDLYEVDWWWGMPSYKTWTISSYTTGNNGGKVNTNLRYEISLMPEPAAPEEAPKTYVIKYEDDKGNTLKPDSEPAVIVDGVIPAPTDADTENITADDGTVYVNDPDATKTEIDENGNTIITLVFNAVKEPVKYTVNFVDENGNPIGISSEEREGEDGQNVAPTEDDKGVKVGDEYIKTIGNKTYVFIPEQTPEFITLDKDGKNILNVVFKEKTFNLTIRYQYADRNPNSETFGEWTPLADDVTVAMRPDGTLPGGAVAPPYLPNYKFVDCEIDRSLVGANGEWNYINHDEDTVISLNPEDGSRFDKDYTITIRYEKAAEITVKYVYEDEKGELHPISEITDKHSDAITRPLYYDELTGNAYCEKVITPILDGYFEADAWIEDKSGEEKVYITQLSDGNSEIVGVEGIGSTVRDYTVIVKYGKIPQAVDYTIKFIDEEGNEIKGTVKRTGIEGDEVFAEDGDKVVITTEDGTQYEYIKGSGDDPITLVKDGTNEIVLKFKKINEYTLTVKYFFDGKQYPEYEDVTVPLEKNGSIKGAKYENGILSGVIKTPIVSGKDALNGMDYMLWDTSINRWDGEDYDATGGSEHITFATKDEVDFNWNPEHYVIISGITFENEGDEVAHNYVIEVDYLSKPSEGSGDGDGGQTPPPADDGGNTTPPPTDDGGNTTPPTTTPQDPVTPPTNTPNTPNTPAPNTPNTPEPNTPNTPAPNNTPDIPAENVLNIPTDTAPAVEDNGDSAITRDNDTADTAITAEAPVEVPVEDLIPGTTAIVIAQDTPVATVAVNDNGDMTLTEIPANETPLANMDLGHLCNILYFLILIATAVVLGFYFSSAKKHQKRIFELREELGEDDPYRRDRQ